MSSSRPSIRVWYQGRVHIHFKVRTSPGASSGLQFTSQLFFDESLTRRRARTGALQHQGPADTTNTTDGIYQGGGSQVLIPLSSSGGGYAGTFTSAFGSESWERLAARTSTHLQDRGACHDGSNTHVHSGGGRAARRSPMPAKIG